MFCQESKRREGIIAVTTFNTSQEILDLSRHDNTMRVRLAGVSDLIARDGKYNKKCVAKFKYSARRVRRNREKTI